MSTEIKGGAKADRDKLGYVAINTEVNAQRDADSWCTPIEYVDAARRVLGEIELDPYSNEYANSIVAAKHFFTINNPAENHEWDCKTLFTNPPYAARIIKIFACKFIEEYQKYHFSAIIVVNNATETGWYRALLPCTSCVCFTDHRIAFNAYDEKFISNNTRGQVFMYFGDNKELFQQEFKKFGYFMEYCHV